MAPLFSNISIQYMKNLFQSFHNSGDYMTKFIHIFDIVFVGVGSPSTAICLQMMHAATTASHHFIYGAFCHREEESGIYNF